MKARAPQASSSPRFLPRVDKIAGDLPASYSHAQRVRAARQSIDELREELRNTSAHTDTSTCTQAQVDSPEGFLYERALSQARRLLQEWEAGDGSGFPPRVLNATGIIVHTGLGRSRLSQAAIRAAQYAATDGCALEVEVESGQRGQRDSQIAALLRKITGCEDATVVNNGAGATLLALAALCVGRSVACSRGELVEIGGGFRMPDVMAQSGATLVEVGCTNKTRLSDYSGALSQVLAQGQSGALLKVHPSNFRIEGFTEEVSIHEMALLAREHGVPLVDDLGSGALVNLSHFGLPGEPTVGEHVKSGADAVIFSGDKLLGGPQCGIICGKSEPIALIRRHPLARALRCDKMTLAALRATLEAYHDEYDNFARARNEIPTLQALTESPKFVRARAQKMARRLRTRLRLPQVRPDIRSDVGVDTWQVSVRASAAQAGAGSPLTRDLPSWSLVLNATGCAKSGRSVEDTARELRQGALLSPRQGSEAPSRVGVWGRVSEGALWFDARCLRDEDVDTAVEVMARTLRHCR